MGLHSLIWDVFDVLNVMRAHALRRLQSALEVQRDPCKQSSLSISWTTCHCEVIATWASKSISKSISPRNLSPIVSLPKYLCNNGTSRHSAEHRDHRCADALTKNTELEVLTISAGGGIIGCTSAYFLTRQWVNLFLSRLSDCFFIKMIWRLAAPRITLLFTRSQSSKRHGLLQARAGKPEVS